MSELGGQEEVYNILERLSKVNNNHPVHYTEIVKEYLNVHDIDLKVQTCQAYLSRLQEKGCISGSVGKYKIVKPYFRKNKERYSIYVEALKNIGGVGSSVKIADKVNDKGHKIVFYKVLPSLNGLVKRGRIFKHPSIDRYYLNEDMYRKEIGGVSYEQHLGRAKRKDTI